MEGWKWGLLRSSWEPSPIICLPDVEDQHVGADGGCVPG